MDEYLFFKKLKRFIVGGGMLLEYKEMILFIVFFSSCRDVIFIIMDKRIIVSGFNRWCFRVELILIN